MADFDYPTVRDILARRIGNAILDAAELEAALVQQEQRHGQERQELMDQLARAQQPADEG